MKGYLVGILKKGEMKHLFGKHSESLCEYNSISLEKITRTTYVVLFRLENDHFECHTLDDIEQWFSKNKTVLPNTRAELTMADINRVLEFYSILNPPPPPPSSPPPPVEMVPLPIDDRFVTIRSRSRREDLPGRFKNVTRRRR